MSMEEMCDALVNMGVSNQTLTIVISINGYKEDTMTDILYAHSGLRSFDQIEG